MQFVNNTLINPEALANDIPVIHGKDYYIDEQAIVCTYNQKDVKIIDRTGSDVEVSSINQITENIFIINNFLSYKLASNEILVTQINCSRSVYKGAFQGIVGFNEGETTYQYLNNTSVAGSTTYTGRLNNNKHLEINIGGTWYVPNGEFRCYIDETFFCINSQSTLPNSFGETFTVTLASWTEATGQSETDPTNYIKDIFIQGNTLYLSTRKQLIGSTPFDWSDIDTTKESVIWSEDSRFINTYFYGEPSADVLFCVDLHNNTIYLLNSSNFEYINSYDHNYQITACNNIDKQMMVIVDKKFVTIINFYQQLNNYLLKTQLQYEFKQMSAYEDLPEYPFYEDVTFIKSINTIAIKSSYRQNMLIYTVGNKVSSACHTDTNMILTDWEAYLVLGGTATRYSLVEDNMRYDEVSQNEIKEYSSYIYIGSDLEADLGGSTTADTQILFEGKICIEDERGVISVESSGDKPVASDYPVRTNQVNPENNWYLYSKTLRYPVSYTDWFKITMMPTTRIYSISLINQTEQTNSNNNKSKRRRRRRSN